MATVFITGSTRGLGLELVKQLTAQPENKIKNVIASGRSESSALKSLIASPKNRVQFVTLNVTDQASVKAAADQVASSVGHVDILLNSAGMSKYFPNGIATMDDLMAMFELNVNGAHMVTAAFMPLLQKGNLKKVINISTTMGSFDKAMIFAQAPNPSYKISKAALNMLTLQWAVEYEDQGFAIMAISPGWLKTDLGGSGADLTVEEGVKGVVDIIMTKGKESNGKFLNIHVPGWEENPGSNQYEGAELAW